MAENPFALYGNPQNSRRSLGSTMLPVVDEMTEASDLESLSTRQTMQPPADLESLSTRHSLESQLSPPSTTLQETSSAVSNLGVDRFDDMPSSTKDDSKVRTSNRQAGIRWVVVATLLIVGVVVVVFSVMMTKRDGSSPSDIVPAEESAPTSAPTVATEDLDTPPFVEPVESEDNSTTTEEPTMIVDTNLTTGVNATAAPIDEPSSPTPAPTLGVSQDTVFSTYGGSIYGSSLLERFGSALAMSSDGSVLAVGGPGRERNTNVGVVRVFRDVDGIWLQLGEPLQGDREDDYFGTSVALSGDGSLLAVGSPQSYLEDFRNTGYVRVFELNVQGNWEQTGDKLAGEKAGDWFGSAVALSGDGSTLVVGAPQGGGGDGYTSAFVRDVNATSGWRLFQTFSGGNGDRTGGSVSLSADGSFVAIGSTHRGRDRMGHVDVYRLGANDIYIPLGGRLTGTERYEYFGEAVSLSADGKTVAVGSLFGGDEVESTGQVQVYHLKTDILWEQLGSSLDGKITRGFFGQAVALSANGRTLAASADGLGASTTSIYYFDSSDWILVGDQLSGETNLDAFGAAIAISDSGRKLAVGAPRNDYLGPDTGLVVTYMALDTPEDSQ